MTGNFVTKVIYIPDPEFQEMALAGVGTLVSTKLDPGQDPIVEADRKGAIMAIVRLGNKDLAIASATPEQMPGGPGAMYQSPMQGPYPPGFVAGVTSPQYGMPISGTPIGLAGPPHVPLGVPAGLQRDTIVNHTHVPPATASSTQKSPESRLEHVSTATFEEQVLKCEKTVLVDFCAEWCIPCKQLGPVLEDFAQAHPEVRMVKVNIDENSDLVARYEVKSIPSLLVIRGGQVTSRSTGVITKEKLAEMTELGAR
jgi:thioredoxin